MQTIGTIVFFPSMFTAGVYFPVQAMQGWLHTVVVLDADGRGVRGTQRRAAWVAAPDLVDLA